MFREHRRVIMAGDPNCKHRVWGNNLCTPKGIRLLRFFDTAKISCIPRASGPRRRSCEEYCLRVLSIGTLPYPSARSNRVAFVTVIEWESYGHALCHRLPEQLPLDTRRSLVRRCRFSAVDVPYPMKTGFPHDYQRMPAEVQLLA